MKKRIVFIVTALLCAALLVGCSAKGDNGWSGAPYPDGYFTAESGDGNMFDEIVENPFSECTEENKTASVSLTVNTAAFPIMRRYLNEGMEIPKNAVKIEEIINYFNYDYAEPENGETVALNGAVIDTPWNSETKLVTLGVRAKTAETENVSNNIVFLVDVSGSMEGKDRLDLAKESFKALAETMTERDVISIVTYASGTKVILDGARGNEKDKINKAVNKLKAGGSTAGASGIDLAYRTAFKYAEECDNSVIVIATDGDFNVGASTPEALKEQISENRRKGVYLSALGFGFNNLSDMNMQEIVASGQGAYAYIDSLDAARAALIGNRAGILYFVAEEAKAQVEFNPSVVSAFRLIGFENKMITDEEFESSDTPAGALSSASQVTAVFEIKLRKDADGGDIGEFKVAYRERKGAEEKRTALAVTRDLHTLNAADTAFIASVVDASYAAVIERLGGLNIDQSDRKYEFVDFVNKLNNQRRFA